MAVASLPVQVLRGIYLGVLTGIIPALTAWALAFAFRYITNITVPSFAIVVLGVAIAGVNGGFLAFNDPNVVQSANSVTLVTAILVVMMMSFYAHARGDQTGAAAPHRFTLRSLRERTLARDVVDFTGSRGRVTVRVVGTVTDMEGYPSLPEPVRAEIRGFEGVFPSDLALPELESRVADRLRTQYDLADVTVTLDEQARASVGAAPPMSGVSRRVPDGRRAVSVSALVPSGVARGDEVTVHTGEEAIAGTVVSASSGRSTTPTPTTGSDDDSTPAPSPTAPTTTGGDGRVTVAVTPPDAQTLLGVDGAAIVVTSRGTRREFELVALIRRAGGRIRRLTAAGDGPLDGATLRAVNLREDYAVVMLAVRRDGTWVFGPDGDTRIDAGDDVFVAGERSAVTRFVEVAG